MQDCFLLIHTKSYKYPALYKYNNIEKVLNLANSGTARKGFGSSVIQSKIFSGTEAQTTPLMSNPRAATSVAIRTSRLQPVNFRIHQSWHSCFFRCLEASTLESVEGLFTLSLVLLVQLRNGEFIICLQSLDLSLSP